jgi:hypothetical protein
MNTTPLSPDEFARAWGDNALVRLPPGAAAIGIPKSSRDFLKRAGLPALVHYFLGSTDAKMTFLRLKDGLTPVSEEKTVGPPLPRTWSSYWILGDEFFCNGSAWWCVCESSGHVCRVDIELSEPVQFGPHERLASRSLPNPHLELRAGGCGQGCFSPPVVRRS